MTCTEKMLAERTIDGNVWVESIKWHQLFFLAEELDQFNGLKWDWSIFHIICAKSMSYLAKMRVFKHNSLRRWDFE